MDRQKTSRRFDEKLITNIDMSIYPFTFAMSLSMLLSAMQAL